MRNLIKIITLISFLLVGVQNSFADEESRSCVRQAKSENQSCAIECRLTRDNTVLNCLTPDGTCGDACKAAFTACVEPFNVQREACQDTCDTTFETSRTACGIECSCTPDVNCGSGCFGSCVDGPAIIRAACRTSCIRNSTYRNGVKACGRALKLCSKGCSAS